MKKDKHPKLKNAKVVCTGCGNNFETLSVKELITVTVCNECHPFLTGAKKLVDTEGRIEKFNKKYKNLK